MKWKVSIIVPVYNVKDYLTECLDSLVGQTIDDYEIVLVNDGSTDGSDLICKEYNQKYDNIKYLTQENKGQSCARNHGLAHAEGEFILFVDSDDYIVLDACEKLYDAAIKYDVDIVVGDLYNERDRIEGDGHFRYTPAENKRTAIRDYARFSFEYGMYDIIPCIKLVRYDLLVKNQIYFFEGCYYEDHEYTMRLFTLNEGYAVKIRFPFYYYRMDRDGSTTNSATRKKGEDFIKIIRQMHKELGKDSLDEDAAEVGRRMLGLSYYHFAAFWLRVENDSAVFLQQEFQNLIKENPDSFIACNTLNNKMRETVLTLLSHPWRLRNIYHFKQLAKRILRGYVSRR